MSDSAVLIDKAGRVVLAIPQEIQDAAGQISDTLLLEQRPEVRRSIRRVTVTLGVQATWALVQEAQAVEAEGGMYARDGRRRTLGGVFFQLVERDMSPEEWKGLGNPLAWQRVALARALQRGETWPLEPPRPLIKPPKAIGEPSDAEIAAAVWAERQQIYEELVDDKGRATNVRITLVGRPAKIKERQNVVVALLEQTHKLPQSLPKGVPQPPAEPTRYVVYIGSRHWTKVVGPLRKNPDMVLVIEGLCSYEPALPGIAVFATHVSTKQRKGAPTPRSDAPSPTAPPSAAPRPPTASAKLPPSLTPELRERYAALRQAEIEARQALGQIRTLPPDEQTEIGAVLQQLQAFKTEMRTLEGKFPELRRS